MGKKKPSCNFAEPCEVLFKRPKGSVVSSVLDALFFTLF